MEEFLVATHVTSLTPSPSTSVSIQTARQHLPLPQLPYNYNSIPTEHAIFSSTLDTQTTGTILLRLIHGGLIVELVSLSSEIPPLRLVFPSLLLDFPAIFLWEDAELHVLAITEAGSLYRVVIPIQGRNLWKNEVDNIWPREYPISNFPEETRGCFVHAQGAYCVAISLPNGSLLRLEADSLGYDGHDEEWTESLFHRGSFLSSITSFIHSGQPNGADIISIATHPWPSDIAHVWTLSRDRTLRLWKAKLGCVATKTLPYNIHTLETSQHSNSSGGSSGGRNYPLLDEARQNLLKVFSSEDGVYVLAFIPSLSSVVSGGFFCLVDVSNDQFREVGIVECSKRTAHCHLQDFIIQQHSQGATLVTLWESQGRSTIEKTSLDIEALEDRDIQSNIWRPAFYGQEPELTPAYMEEKLLAPGSVAEKFLEAIFKPGVFSSLSLRTALDQYTDACLSLPGPPPPQLMSTYATLCENVAAVVGCTVVLNRDPQSGALQYGNYWTALKRDWEGFVARCREVERSARWPLALGSRGSEKIVILERERVGCLVDEDMPIYLRRLVATDHPVNDPTLDILAISGALCQKLGPELMSNLESRVLELMHQELAFSLVDILQDLGNRLQVKDSLDEGTASWFQGRLQSISNLDVSTRTAIDTIGGLDFSAKREEEEGSLAALAPSSQSEWGRGLTARYITNAVEARYELSLSLMTLLLFLAGDLATWDPSLLAEVFAVFKGTAMLRFVSVQPAERPSSTSQPGESTAEDDVISRLRNMDVSHNRTPSAAPTSLIHLLLAQTNSAGDIHIAAHHFLDSSGLLQSVSPAYATKFEVVFCERLRLLKFFDVARELLTCLPRTPAAVFVLAQIWLQIGRLDDAAQSFEKVAGSLGPDSPLTAEDAEALSLVLPTAQAITSEFAYYIHISELFKKHLLVRYEVHFAQLAIAAAPPGADSSTLWLAVAKGFVDPALYEEAYATLTAMPYEKQKREFASQLTLRMCEENAVAKLMSFDFAGISDEVESILSFKARNVDPRLQPNYSRILYTWYIQRGEYRNAALTIYQRALKLQEIITSATLFLAFGEEQLDAYSIAINALSLVDEHAQWVILPVIPDSTRKHKTSSKFIPESKFTSSKYDAQIVHLADMQRQYTLLAGQIDIIKREPGILSSPEFLLPPAVIIMRLVSNNLFGQALNLASSLKVDMTDLFIHLTTQCLRLSERSQNLITGPDSDWLLTDNSSTWSGSATDRAWRFLRQSLERYDSADTDYRYSKACLETILSLDRSSPSPPWLVHLVETHHPEYLIRLSLRYEDIDGAVAYTLALVRKSDARLVREPTHQNASSTWLPYTLIDQVMVAASSLTKVPALLPPLRTELANRLKRVQKLSHTSA